MGENQPEGMEEFFDLRAETYDSHMFKNVNNFREFYQAVARPVKPTGNNIKILDLGCGTGLELAAIFSRAPQAKITAVDLSEKMLNNLLEKYQQQRSRIEIRQASYLTVPFEEEHYHYAISVMTLHHLTEAEKIKLYKKIARALKPGGKYVEGDYIALSQKEEKSFLIERRQRLKEVDKEESGLYHIDIPFTLEKQKEILTQAGFRNFHVIYQAGENAVYQAEV